MSDEFGASDLERIKREAKQLRRAAETGDVVALSRLKDLGWTGEGIPGHMQTLELLTKARGFNNLHHATVQARKPADAPLPEQWLRFRGHIASDNPLRAAAGGLVDELLMERAGHLSIYYSPFEHLHEGAKLIIVGLTPGMTQAIGALEAARAALKLGGDDREALRAAKETGAFAGPLRANLIRLLDASGIEMLCACPAKDLFTSRRKLIHTTSAVRYPIFNDGANYNGSVVEIPLLRRFVEQYLAAELNSLGAPVIALGRHADAAMELLARLGRLPRQRYLGQLPHPSGANAGRVSEALTASPASSPYARMVHDIRQKIAAMTADRKEVING